MQPYISFVIPVYNEEENIPILFRELTTVAEKSNSTYEIIFVNDCSTDRSLEVIRELEGKHPAGPLCLLPGEQGPVCCSWCRFPGGCR